MMNDFYKINNINKNIDAIDITDAYHKLVKLVNKNGKTAVDQRNDVSKQVYGVTVRIAPPINNNGDIDHPKINILGAPNIEQAKYFANSIVKTESAVEMANEFDYSYGDRLRNNNALAVHASVLKKEPSSRRCWTPIFNSTDIDAIDCTGREVPCCVGVDFQVGNGKLNFMSVFRSNDVALAFPSDAVGFRALQVAMAGMLGMEIGEYLHIISSAHIRCSDQDYVDAFVETKQSRSYTNLNEIMEFK